MPITRTLWTKAEYRKVATETARIENDHKSLTAAVDAAQRNVLPETRWRKKPNGPSGLLAFMPYLEESRAFRKAHAAELPDPPQTPPALPGEWGVKAAPMEDHTGIDSEASMTPPHYGQQPPVAASIDEALLPIRDILSDYIAGILVDSVRKLLTNGEIARVLRSMAQGAMPEVVRDVQPVPKHNPAPFPQVPRDSKKTVLVCGLLPHQQSEFQRGASDLPLHLKFWYAEKPSEGLGVLREKAANVDVVLFKMDATSHTAVNVVSTLGKRTLRVTGGGSAMYAALKGLV